MSWYTKFKQEKVVIQQSGKHNKFWRSKHNETDNSVTVSWGRLGTKGQSQVKQFDSEYSAINFIRGKISEKFRKGYEEVDTATADRLSIEAAIVGSQNKCHKCEWVEIVENGTYKTIDEQRLYHPDCNPGLLVSMQTKKEYDGKHDFDLLFGVEDCYLMTPFVWKKVEPGTDIHKLTQSVQEAIGRNL